MKEQKKSKGFSHFILTRFNNGVYDNPKVEDPARWMRERIKLFRATRESVLSQEGDFKWVLSFDENTPDKDIDKIITDERMIATAVDIRNFFDDYEVDTEWVITSRMDNDDLYLPGAVKAIQDRFTEQIYLIDIDYYQYDLESMQKYTSGNESKGQRYRMLNNGPFLSLVESSKWIKTCYSRPHTKMPDGYPFENGYFPIANCKIEEPLAMMVIHDENMMNKITGYRC